MKKLHLTFVNSEGKKHKMIPRVADENLSGQTVRQVMADISGLPLFVKNGVTLFVAPATELFTEEV